MTDIRWGSYKEFEGPWTPGVHRFQQATSQDSKARKIMSVITATEGGAYDAINRYDSCIDTQGIIQWCNKAPQRSIDKLYAYMYEYNPELLSPVQYWARAHGFKFQVTSAWEGFVRVEDGRYIDTPALQRSLYFDDQQAGQRGSWTPEARRYATQFVEASREVWDHQDARALQDQWTAARLDNFFTTKTARDMLAGRPTNDLGAAYYAAFLSFAANNPRLAEEALVGAATSLAAKGPNPWSREWVSSVLQRHCLHGNVAIYRDRYRKIVPVIADIYGVVFPSWNDMVGQRAAEPWMDVRELQGALRLLGFDLDLTDVWDRKTRAAWLDFEKQEGVQGIDGLPDHQSIRHLSARLEAVGTAALQDPQ